jgi:dinuclear metal center YbgI/SA1388 family protein
MQIAQVIRALEAWAPPAYQESYDNAQLICGDPNADVQSVLCTLDCTEAIVEEAIERGCQLIVAHHPIVFRGLKSLSPRTYVERTVIKAIKNDIAIYAIHTNLDKVATGVNHGIANRIGLQNTRILQMENGHLCKLVCFIPVDHLDQVRKAIFEAGAGQIGNYDCCAFSSSGKGSFRGNEDSTPFVGEAGKLHEEEEVRLETILPASLQSSVIRAMTAAHPYEEVAYDIYPLAQHFEKVGLGMIGDLARPMDEKEFLDHLRKSMSCEVVRHTPLLGQKIERVAICGGAGSSLLRQARRQGAQIYVSADFKYHEFFDAEGQIVIADIGHYETEQFVPDGIAAFLREKFDNFAVLSSQVGTNPVKYYYGR